MYNVDVVVTKVLKVLTNNNGITIKPFSNGIDPTVPSTIFKRLCTVQTDTI